MSELFDIAAQYGDRTDLNEIIASRCGELMSVWPSASITRAGRCYVQVGMDEVYELFQSYSSDASYFGDGRGEQGYFQSCQSGCDRWYEIKNCSAGEDKIQVGRDELAAVVKYLGMQACEMGIRKLDGPWLPELPEYLPLEQMERTVGFLEHGWNSHPRWLLHPYRKV